MKKLHLSIIALVAISMFFGGLSAPSYAKKVEEKTKKQKQVERYRKIYGEKKKKSGSDYSAQSTAGVEGGAKEGLHSKDAKPSVDDVKKELYENPSNTIEKIIKTKDIKK